MNIIIKRFTLALIMCEFSIVGLAQVIFSESFTGYTQPNIEGWSFFHCSIRSIDKWPTSLCIEKKNNDDKEKGYAITPKLNYTGNVILSFKMAVTTQKKTATITISTDNGSVTSPSNTASASSQSLTNKSFYLTLSSNDARIKFQLTSDPYAVIDDIIVMPDAFTIAENTDNTSFLELYDAKTVTVNTHRTLLGGIWNTLCLPFDVSMADLELALGKNQDIQVRTFHSYDSATKVMTFVDPFGEENSLSAISAGTPFLIKLNSDVENPTFHAVTISNTAAQSIGEDGPVQFVGTYSPVELATDGTNIFITRDNTLALPAEGKNTMNGLRAYIVVPEEFDSSGARLLMDDGETASVSDLAPSVETGSKATYSLNGQRVENVRRGLYVVNGKLTLVK